MGFAFNIWVALIGIMVPAVVLGLLCGTLSHRWPVFRYPGTGLIALFLLWVAVELLWPWNRPVEASAFRWQIAAVIVSSVALGISLQGYVSRMRQSRPAI